MVKIEAKQEGIIPDPPSYASEYDSVQLSNGPTVCLVGPTRTRSQNLTLLLAERHASKLQQHRLSEMRSEEGQSRVDVSP